MENNYLIHHGVKGQKWGVRRYQNADGTLTSAGLKRKETIDKAVKYSSNQQHASETLARSYDPKHVYKKDPHTDYEELHKGYKKSAQEWLDTKNKLLNTPVSQLSRKDYKKVKKWAKAYDKNPDVNSYWGM